MNADELFAEAKRLNLRMLGTPEETRAALDAKDAEIATLRAEVARLKEHAVVLAETARQVERERCALVCDVTPPYPFRPSIEAAHAIRTFKDAP